MVCFVVRTNGPLLLGFRGAVLDFRGLDYEIQTLGATEGARFSELQKALITMSILSNLSIRIVLSILKNSEKLRIIYHYVKERVYFRKTMQRYDNKKMSYDLERLRAK